MIICTNCHQKYHFVCVDFDFNDSPRSFLCTTCEPKQHNVSSSTRILDKSFSSRFDRQSIDTKDLFERLYDVSAFSRQLPDPRSPRRSISKHNAQLELDYLEAQKIFHERRDREKEIREQEYLLKKYEILKGQEQDGAQSVNHRSEYTESWVNKLMGSQQSMNPEHKSKNELQIDQHKPPEESFDMTGFLERLERLKFDDAPRNQGYETKDRNQPIKDVNNQSLTSLQRPNTSKPNPSFEQSKQGNVKIPPYGIFPPANQNLQPKIASEQESTLTKAQIASRQVVKSTLKQFYGDPLEWISWIISYENSTSLCGYTNGENLLRLKDCLKGKAETAVKHRLLSPSEVPNIISTLRMLYGRPELIINTLLKTIKDIQAPKPDKLDTLVDFAMEVNNINATIESAKLHHHSSNSTLIYELEEKLPTHTKIDWAKFKATKPNVTLKLLADWLFNLAEILCTVTVPSTSKAEVKTDNKPRKGFERVNVHQVDKEDKPRPYKSQMVNNTTDANVKPSDQCKICYKRCTDVSECSVFKSYDINRKWEAIKKYKLCRKCLRRHDGYCQLTKECGVNGCVYKHHPTLHNDRQTARNDSSQSRPDSNQTTTVVTNNFHHTSVPNILFRIVPVTLYNNNSNIIIKTYAYLDEGSSGTLVEEDLAKELQLVGLPERLCLMWTNNVHRIEEESHRLNIVISGQNEFTACYEMKGVRTVKDLGLPTQTMLKQKLVKGFPYLNRIPLIDYVNETPRILIGLPHARLCTQLTSIEGAEYEPVASKSRIGWSLHGPTRKQPENYVEYMNTHRVIICGQRSHESDEELHRLVKEHFTLENFGVKINTEFNLDSKENERALNILKDNTKRVDGRFETALLWRYDSFELEDSYDMAKRRLICLEKSKRNFIEHIDATITDYIVKGYVTKLTQHDLAIERSKVGYLPIFIVVHPKKPNKLRMVFDAAAKTKGTSLNDMLLKGPDQLSSLVDILRRFREHTVAVCADIFEMYHQIKVCEPDRHVQRFLWRNGDKNKEPDVYVLNVMTFGAKCSPSSAQFVKNQNAEEFREEFPKAVNAIVTNTYVDDMMDGDETDDKVIQLVKDAQRIHKHGGFQIGKFLSNSSKVLEALGEQKDNNTKQLEISKFRTSLRNVLEYDYGLFHVFIEIYKNQRRSCFW